MNNPLLAAALDAAALLSRIPREHTTGGPAGFRNVSPAKKEPDDRDERVCKAICPMAADGSKDHRVRCKVGIAEFNQAVNTRQVRRLYARTMKKRGVA